MDDIDLSRLRAKMQEPWPFPRHSTTKLEVRAGTLTVERLLDMAADDLPDLILALDLKGSGVYPVQKAGWKSCLDER